MIVSSLAVKSLGCAVSDLTLTVVGTAAGYGVMALSTGFVSGVTSAAYELIDGKSWAEARSAFLFGTAVGAAFSIAFPLLGKGLSYVGKGISAVGRKLASKIPHKWLTNLTSKLSGKVTSFIKDHNIHQIHLKNSKLEDLLAPKSIYQSTKQAIIEVRTEQLGGDWVTAKAIVNLPSDKNKNFKYVDKSGNPLKKDDLYKNGGEGILKLSDACDEEVKKKFLEKGVTELKINNGVVDFSPVADYKFVSNLGIGPERDINMKNYYDQLADTWSLDEANIPQKIQDGLKKNEC